MCNLSAYIEGEEISEYPIYSFIFVVVFLNFIMINKPFIYPKGYTPISQMSTTHRQIYLLEYRTLKLLLFIRFLLKLSVTADGEIQRLNIANST